MIALEKQLDIQLLHKQGHTCSEIARRLAGGLRSLARAVRGQGQGADRGRRYDLALDTAWHQSRVGDWNGVSRHEEGREDKRRRRGVARSENGGARSSGVHDYARGYGYR